MKSHKFPRVFSFSLPLSFNQKVNKDIRRRNDENPIQSRTGDENFASTNSEAEHEEEKKREIKFDKSTKFISAVDLLV
jgi:hypothetical protein